MFELNTQLSAKMNINATANETQASPLFSCPLLDRFLNESRGSLRTVYVINCAINGVFLCSAVLANALIMATILRKPCLRSPTFYLLFGLAVSDFGVGLIAQPLYILYKIAGLYENFNLNCAAGIAFVLASNQLSGVSFLTVTLVSVDRFLGLYLHLRYNELVTLYRVKIALVCTWVLITFENVAWLSSLKVFYMLSSCGFVLFLIATLFIYIWIFHTVRRHRLKISQQSVALSHLGSSCSQENADQDISSSNQTPNEEKRLDVTGYKKSVKTMFLIYFVFLICVLPMTFVLVISTILGRNTTVETAFNFTMTLMFINSTVNPLLYCFLMRDLRREVWNTLGSVIGHLRQA